VKNKMGKLIIVESEAFTRSQCDCDFCRETHLLVDREWGQYQARTPLQRRMIKVVSRIERRERRARKLIK